MPKTKISEYSTTNSSNTDIEGINIDEGCAPSGINNAIRELMVHLKEFQTGASGDAFTFAGGVLISGTANTITGNVLMSGTNTITGSTTATFAAGAVGTPSIAAHGDTNTGIFFPAADTIAFAEGGAEAMRIDSSGNVGIGTSSPTASASNKTVTINGPSGSGALIDFKSNETLNFRIFSGSASSVLSVKTATPLIFDTNDTERMRINSSGSVGIGTSSPNATLHVQGSGTTDGSIVFNQQLTATTAYNSSPQSGSMVSLKYNTGGDFAGMGGWSIIKENGTDGNFAGAMLFHTRANGGAITERARITSGGLFKVVNNGSTIENSTGGVNEINTAANDTNTVFRNTASSLTGARAGVDVVYTAAAPNGTTSNFYNASDTGAKRFEVRSNGGIGNYSANNVNLSDRREKINFAPAGEYLSKICAIPVQTFNYIDQNTEDDPGLTLGVVAQDVQEVAPELVMESNWGTQKEPKMRLSIYQTDFQYALMKSIQELKAITDAQATRIETLEAEVAAMKAQ